MNSGPARKCGPTEGKAALREEQTFIRQTGPACGRPDFSGMPRAVPGSRLMGPVRDPAACPGGAGMTGGRGTITQYRMCIVLLAPIAAWRWQRGMDLPPPRNAGHCPAVLQGTMFAAGAVCVQVSRTDDVFPMLCAFFVYGGMLVVARAPWFPLLCVGFFSSDEHNDQLVADETRRGLVRLSLPVRTDLRDGKCSHLGQRAIRLARDLRQHAETGGLRTEVALAPSQQTPESTPTKAT